MQPGGVVIVGAGNSKIDANVVKSVRGSLFENTDSRFLIIALLSIVAHVVWLVYLHTIDIPKHQGPAELEKVPERFAKLIIDKPLPKEKPKASASAEQGAAEGSAKEEQSGSAESAAPAPPKTRTAAKKAVAARAAQVEQKIRTVGVLGMLTGVGTTAKGPAVVDVLGAVNNRRERFQDLDKALENISGLQKTGSEQTMKRKLVKSKDVAVSHTETIDHLIAGVGTASLTSLAKKGDFVVRKPESIEGAASSHAKRDERAIRDVVTAKKLSIRMTYERYLKRDPQLAGKIAVRWTITASGRVTNVTVLENTTGSDELARDIIRRIKTWRFEAISEGDVTVTYPFVFQPS